MQKKIQRKSIPFQIKPSELFELSCIYYEENTCHQQSMFEQTILRDYMSLRVIFSNSITFPVINQYGKGPGVKIESVFRPICHVVCRGVLSNGSF